MHFFLARLRMCGHLYIFARNIENPMGTACNVI